MDIPYRTFFLDFNSTNPSLLSTNTEFEFETGWASAWDSGYTAAMEGTNMSQYLLFYPYVLNGTSRKIRQHVQRTFGLNTHPGGISPIVPTFDNWTRVEAIQPGVTADVNCTQTSPSDPYIHINQTAAVPGMNRVFSCCNCTSASELEVSGNKGCPLLVQTLASY